MARVYVLLLRSSKLSVDIAKMGKPLSTRYESFVQSPVQKKLINENKDTYMPSFFPLLLLLLFLFLLSLSLCTSFLLASSLYILHTHL